MRIWHAACELNGDAVTVTLPVKFNHLLDILFCQTAQLLLRLRLLSYVVQICYVEVYFGTTSTTKMTATATGFGRLSAHAKREQSILRSFRPFGLTPPLRLKTFRAYFSLHFLAPAHTQTQSHCALADLVHVRARALSVCT